MKSISSSRIDSKRDTNGFWSVFLVNNKDLYKIDLYFLLHKQMLILLKKLDS